MGDTMTTATKPKEEFVNDHVDYPDIWPRGLEEYPFARSRIVPIIYEIPDGAKVLDVGCNSGEFIKYLRDKKGCDVTGADISAKVVDICKEKGLNAVLCDADKLPFPDGTFDVVTLMEVLEHFHEPVPYLKEIRRVLKPSGFLLGTCPHANLERYIWDDHRLHQQYYDEAGIRKDLGQAFEVSHLQILKGAQFNLGFANSFLAREPAEILFKCGGHGTEPWEEQMRKGTALRVWMGWTQLSGDVYYRMRGYADRMRDMGIEVAYEDFSYDGTESQKDWQNRIRNRMVLDTLDHILKVADMSVWQLVGNRECLAFLRCAKDVIKRPIITEIDDWIFDLPAYNIAANPYNPNSEPEWVCAKQLELSDAFICSTSFIREKLLESFPKTPVYVIPNGIDFAIWDKVEPVVRPEVSKAEGKIRIGYTGCGNHDGDMDIVKRPIMKLCEEFPNLEFVSSHVFPSWTDFPKDRFIDSRRWVTINKYPQEVAGWGMDIGIAPLRDNNFNRAKSNLRWLEFSALKIPTVASRVRPFKESVTEGVDGLLCSSEKEWYDALKSLIVDESRRRALGETAYGVVKARFNMDEIAKDYAKTLQEIKLCSEANLKQK